MLLSLQTDYALRVLVDIATNGRSRTMLTRTLATRQHVPPIFLTKIVGKLATRGFVRTQRGKGGGVTLARDPSQINLLEVVEVFEGRLRANRCTASQDSCTFASDCALRELWQGAEGRLRDYLGRFSLADLVKTQAPDEEGGLAENTPS